MIRYWYRSPPKTISYSSRRFRSNDSHSKTCWEKNCTKLFLQCIAFSHLMSFYFLHFSGVLAYAFVFRVYHLENNLLQVFTFAMTIQWSLSSCQNVENFEPVCCVTWFRWYWCWPLMIYDIIETIYIIYRNWFSHQLPKFLLSKLFYCVYSTMLLNCLVNLKVPSIKIARENVACSDGWAVAQMSYR